MNIVDFDDDVVAAESTGAAPDKSDFEDGAAATFTIVRVDRNVQGRNGNSAETKRVLILDDTKSLPINRTNLALLARWFGSRRRFWVGKHGDLANAATCLEHEMRRVFTGVVKQVPATLYQVM
jgi:hypothetical protein